MRTLLLFILSFCFLSAHIRAQSFAYGGQFKGSSADYEVLEDLAIDAAGNSYIIGGFHNTIDFDPGPGVFNLSALGGFSDTDMFIVKLSVTGQLIWVKQIGGPNIDVAREITINPAGYIEVTADFRGTIDVDPGPGVVNLTSASGNGDACILRLSLDGNFISVRQFSASLGSNIALREMAITQSGDLVITSTFSGTIDFDPGPGVYNLTSSNNDIVIVRFSANGTFSWAKRVASGGSLMPNELVIDKDDNIVYGGYFNNTVDFDPGLNVFNLVSDDGLESFISKLSPAGEFIWAKHFRNLGNGAVFTVTTDAGGNVYAGGFYEAGALDADPGPGTFLLNNSGSRDAFAVKLTKDGDFSWAARFAGSASDQVNTVNIGSDGGMYFGLSFSTTVDMDPGPGIFNLVSKGETDLALLRLNPDGSFDWAKQMGGTKFGDVAYVKLDPLDNIYLTGTFAGTLDLDPGPNTFNVTEEFNTVDIFVAKLSRSNLITGTTFQDFNSDGIRQPGEPPLSNIVLKAKRGDVDYYAISDSIGRYRLMADTGSYFITPNLPLFYTSINPASHNAAFNSQFGQLDSANHFGLIPSSIIKDLKIYITNLGPARQGRSTLYQITYLNKGTETISGSVTMKMDAGLSFVSASPAAAASTATELTWNFSNLAPSQHRDIVAECLVAVGPAPGSFLRSYATVNPVAGDFDPDSNTDSVYHLITASFDPNDKKVSPSGGITTDFVSSGKYLDYTVRFQNTGNDTAFLVVIKDTLSTNLDISSFETLSASHPFTVNMYKDGVAEWRFNNILLPDSNVNEARSHGFVRYRIKPKNTLAPGDQVKNTAAIYFDYNLPVITNQTLNTVTVVTSVNPASDPIESKIFPNPARSVLYVQVKDQFNYRLYSAAGKEAIAADNCRNETIIDIQRLNKGVYFLEVKTKKGRVVRQILIQ